MWLEASLTKSNTNLTEGWNVRLVSFWNRIAELGHFEPVFDDPIPAVQAMIGVINGNPKLEIYQFV